MALALVHGKVPRHTLEYPPLRSALLCVYMHLLGAEARKVKMRIAGTNCYLPLQVQQLTPKLTPVDHPSLMTPGYTRGDT